MVHEIIGCGLIFFLLLLCLHLFNMFNLILGYLFQSNSDWVFRISFYQLFLTRKEPRCSLSNYPYQTISTSNLFYQFLYRYFCHFIIILPSVLYGLWTVDYGLLRALLSSMDYGLWTVDFFVPSCPSALYGLWTVDYGLFRARGLFAGGIFPL